MNLPTHLVVIPDGNRRWAKKRNLLAFLGHEEGAKRLEEILDVALELKIPYFTFWASSLDNVIKRSKEEVSFLFQIFEKNLASFLKAKKLTRTELK